MTKKSLIRYGLVLLIISAFSACKKTEKSPSDMNYGDEIEKALKPDSYEKLGLVYEHPQDSIVDQFEVYVSNRGDTIFNQMKRIKNGQLDRSASQFYELELKGDAADSVMAGILRFYSPEDSMDSKRLKERHVIFNYLQRDWDTIKWQKIETDTNVIHFDFKPFNKKKFMGFIADYRYFEVDTSDNYLLVKKFYGVDTEEKTENPFLDILMDQ